MITLASLIERIASKTTATGTGPVAKVLGKAGVATGGQFAELVRLAAAKGGGLPGTTGTTTTAASAALTKAGGNNVVPFTPPAGKAGQTADIALPPAATGAAKLKATATTATADIKLTPVAIDATKATAAAAVAKAITTPSGVKTAGAKPATVAAAATATTAVAKATTAVATVAATATTTAATKTAQATVSGAVLNKQASRDDTAEAADIDGKTTDPTTTRKKAKATKAKTVATAGPAPANAALAASDVVMQAQQLTNKAGKAGETTAGDAKAVAAKVGQVVSSNSAKTLVPRDALPAAPATGPAKASVIQHAEAPATPPAKTSATQQTEASAANQTNAPASHQAKAAAVHHGEASATDQTTQQVNASTTDAKAPTNKTGATPQANATGQPAPGGSGAAMADGQKGGTDTGAQPRHDGQVDKVAGAGDGTTQRAASAQIASILQSLPPGIQAQLGVSGHAAVPTNGPGALAIMAPSTADQLSGQVIDMGVSGQWIDRMAREISALAQGTGHSQFQLSPANLGKIQIDLWQGDSATNVRMLTETADAAQRLDQGKHMLHADARLASLQLGTISIEKAATSQDQSAAQRQAGNMGGQPQRQDSGQAQSQGQAGGNRPNSWTVPTPTGDSTQPSDNQPTDRNANRRWRFA